MSGTPRFIDIHLLQTLPYSNINRDDLGSPKTVVYGGASRTRVSSQSWKRAVRLAVERSLGDPAVRTRRVPEQVAQRLTRRGWHAEAAELAGQQIVASVGKSGLKLDDGMTSVLLYLPASALDGLADLADEHRAEIEAEMGKKKPPAVLPPAKVAAILSARNGVINLFGRMLAELPGAEVDGVVQVAHAFTTHATNTEVDFFTAVDDLNPDDMRGSGHMNSAEFASGVFYRYASVDVADLLANLGGDTAMATELTREFLTAFIAALPTGKQNSTAAYTIPDLAYVAVRSDRPVSLAPAFEAPVRVTGEYGFAALSRDDLADYAARLHGLWGTEGIVRHGYAAIDEVKTIDQDASALGKREKSFAALISSVVTAAYPGAGA
ncbi:type I-E CRISPR-associated protein Cas7/Cse4/CasC [Planomonospora venezuelensis]|uniref:CRISPR system Cascade subunit CasC n=1 Tax=Planomonospora venezuelensis TaxID=1999 RepID=A0A841DB11_PLAVE|nr:type I-E CRISPR-associated protein Cas7/Cse4/CasC [Planomonospora venezuelensis]MBB5965917.1 CRISPR system Cascade subunit CasC [Planomonospora venezuelensis]GIM98998.1 type I-E CRISPR-associated protein Cas7/Cse4/CasC [Planomonospora venezuelensis]